MAVWRSHSMAGGWQLTDVVQATLRASKVRTVDCTDLVDDSNDSSYVNTTPIPLALATVCMCVYVCLCVCVRMCAYVYVCMFVCIDVHDEHVVSVLCVSKSIWSCPTAPSFPHSPVSWLTASKVEPGTR